MSLSYSTTCRIIVRIIYDVLRLEISEWDCRVASRISLEIIQRGVQIYLHSLFVRVNNRFAGIGSFLLRRVHFAFRCSLITTDIQRLFRFDVPHCMSVIAGWVATSGMLVYSVFSLKFTVPEMLPAAIDSVPLLSQNLFRKSLLGY